MAVGISNRAAREQISLRFCCYSGNFDASYFLDISVKSPHFFTGSSYKKLLDFRLSKILIHMLIASTTKFDPYLSFAEFKKVLNNKKKKHRLEMLE